MLEYLRPHRFICLLTLCCLGMLWQGVENRVHAQETDYIESGKTDFDTIVKALQPYGSWEKVDANTYAFDPKVQEVPFSHGRWIYTDYGWFWKGAQAYSWATDHYGSWKRNDHGRWLWYPGSAWEAAPLEFRASGDYLGWRSAALNAEGDYVESQADRYAHPDEWVFVTKEQFANPINASMIPNDKLEDLLENSSISSHSFMTYRTILRVGPHPADIAKFSVDGGVLPPLTLEDRLEMQREARIEAAQTTPQPKPVAIPGKPTPIPSSITDHKPTNIYGKPGAGISGKPVSTGGGSGAFTFTDPATSDLSAPPVQDTRKVKYWIVMALPAYDAPVPPTAKPTELYLYHPDFYQDDDGIQRRIQLVLHPETKTDAADRIEAAISSRILQDQSHEKKAPVAPVALPAYVPPAMPAQPTPTPLPVTTPADLAPSTPRTKGA